MELTFSTGIIGIENGTPQPTIVCAATLTVETNKDYYAIQQLETGELRRVHNGKLVATLPLTPSTKLLMRESAIIAPDVRTYFSDPDNMERVRAYWRIQERVGE